MGHSEQTDLFLILACVIDFVNLLFIFPVVSEIMFGLQRLVIVVTWEKKGGLCMVCTWRAKVSYLLALCC